jgi:glycosyltransferase involved in cell wall biosynthesis
MKLYNYNILLNNSIITIENNNIELSNRKTIILLDYMDIDYILHTPFIKGLGGTQTAYIYLALELSEKYNVIILNKKNNNTIVKQHNIHIIKYNDNVNMINIINNINPNYLIYNFINLGELLRKYLNNSKIKLFMYEHLTIYSNFDMKIYCNYNNFYDKIIFVSQDQYIDYSYYVNINKSNVIILNNTLSPLFYYNNIINNNISNLHNSIIKNKKLNIVYISNPQRGLECFEYIFPILKNKYPNITLDIYSSLAMYDIEDNDNLKNMYNRLINIDGINYNKTTSQYELINVLNESLLFIYPTFVVESFCNSMIEAMSCGCYVISTNLGALKSVAYPYGKFIDINIEDKKKHPYYESIDSNYIDSIIDESCKTIELYLNNSNYLDNYLKEQINYIKNMYKSNTNELFKHINLMKD